MCGPETRAAKISSARAVSIETKEPARVFHYGLHACAPSWPHRAEAGAVSAWRPLGLWGGERTRFHLSIALRDGLVASGELVLALHGHLPWVLGHGRWPHGESWLYEAAAGVYLPLWGWCLRCMRQAHGRRSRSDSRRCLNSCRSASRMGSGRGCVGGSRGRLPTAEVWTRVPGGTVARPSSCPAGPVRWAGWRHRGCVCGAALSRRIELLVRLPPRVRAAAQADRESARNFGWSRNRERHLGFRPTGLWLPGVHSGPRGRGQRRYWASTGTASGSTAFWRRRHHTSSWTPISLRERVRGGRRADGSEVGWDRAEEHPEHGWRAALEPHRVGTHGGMSRVTAFASP